MVNEPIDPIRYMSFNIGPDVGVNDTLIAVRVVPAGREGNTIIGRTLNHGEPDSGEKITAHPGEKLLFPAGNVKISIRDIDRDKGLDPDGYAAVSNTVWTWLLFGRPADPELFRFLFAAARRLDTAHALCVNALDELGDHSNESYVRQRARIFKALGYAELMCVAFSRAIAMIEKIPSEFASSTAVPNSVDAISRALHSIRHAMEHIDERAVGSVRRQQHPDALSIFNQDDFFSSGVLRYANHSLDVQAQVIPALLSARQFIFEAAVEKTGGSLITINEPIEWCFPPSA